MTKSTIILKADADMIDWEARSVIDKLVQDIQKINDRTKIHTIQIKELEKKIYGNKKDS